MYIYIYIYNNTHMYTHVYSNMCMITLDISSWPQEGAELRVPVQRGGDLFQVFVVLLSFMSLEFIATIS